MVIIAKEDFLQYKKGQIVPEEEYRENWSQHVEKQEEKKVVESKPVKKSSKKGDK